MINPTLRRLIAKIGIAALLFTQMAVAAYACPVSSTHERAPATMAGDMHAAMPGCHKQEQDDSNLNLCLQHCQAGSQSVQTTPQVSVPAMATMPLAIIEPAQLESTLGITGLSALHERATSPPPLIRFRFLRI
jgi:hypothetical protein